MIKKDNIYYYKALFIEMKTYKSPFSMDCRGRRSHTPGVYPTQGYTHLLINIYNVLISAILNCCWYSIPNAV